MDVSREALLDELNDFEKKRPNDISPVLEDYLLKIAKCGDTMFPWSKFKLLIRKKLELVMSDFYEDCPTDNIPPVPNVELFKFETMKLKILEAVDAFQSTPFTIQRLCELITNPRQHYKRTDKFMRGIEKNILVVSTIEPRHTDLNSSSNNNNGSMVVNGILDVSTEGDMLLSGQQMDNDNHHNNNSNNNLYGQQDRVTVNGVPIPDTLFNADPTSSTITANSGVSSEIETSSEESRDGSTDSGEYVLKESPLDVMTDITSTSAMPSSVTDDSTCVPLDNVSLHSNDETVLPLDGTMENPSEVEEQARQLLSQVAANIEENNLLEEDQSQDSSKFPVSGAVIDTNLELGFNLGKELNSECVSSDEPKCSSTIDNQFVSMSFPTQLDSAPELAVDSTSVSGEVDSLSVSTSEMDPGILTQMNPCLENSLELQADCTSQNGDICSSNMNVEEPSESSDKMDTESMGMDVPSSTTFADVQCSPTIQESQSSMTQMGNLGESTALGEDPPDLPGLDTTPVSCQSQEQEEEEEESHEEPMDQD